RRGLPGSTMTISPSKDCWSRYGIDANFRVLAEWLGPDFPRAMTFPELQVAQWRAGISCLWKFRIVAWLTSVNRGGSRLDLPPPRIDWVFSFCSHGYRSVRRERLAMFEKIRGRDHSPG